MGLDYSPRLIGVLSLCRFRGWHSPFSTPIAKGS
jgi:hypothetical protein